MLSKILSFRDAGKAHAAVFPFIPSQLKPAIPGVPDREGDTGAAPGAESAALRDTIREMEARSAADRREAFESGRQQGEQQSRTELQPVLERLSASINEITAMRADLRRRAERDVVQLALLIARRILHRDLAMDENALTAIARVAFERLTRSESYTLTVHPRFASAIKAALPSGHASRVKIEADPACAPGTLVIHSSEGVIDASVDAQLEEISRGLTDRLAG